MTDKSAEPLAKKQKTDCQNIMDKFLNLEGSDPRGKASGGSEIALEKDESLLDYNELHLMDQTEEQDEESLDSEEDDENDLSYDSEVPEDEIDALLEEGLPDEMKGPRGQRRKNEDKKINTSEVGYECPINESSPYEKKTRVLLIEKDVNHLEILPEGWIEVSHHSGMPVYLHRESRICTFARPYYIGKGSVRKHNVPLFAIPCLKYRRDIEKLEKHKDDSSELLNKNKKDEKILNENGENDENLNTNEENDLNLDKFEESYVNLNTNEENNIILNETEEYDKNEKEMIDLNEKEENSNGKEMDDLNEKEMVDLNKKEENSNGKEMDDSNRKEMDDLNEKEDNLNGKEMDDLDRKEIDDINEKEMDDLNGKMEVDEIICKNDKRETVTGDEKIKEKTKNKCPVNAAMEDLSSLPSGPLADALNAQTPKRFSEVSDPKIAEAVLKTKVETVLETKDSLSLDIEQLREYCKKIFEFRTINTVRFKSWPEKRRHEKSLRMRNRPVLPDGTKLIYFKRDAPAPSLKKEWILNPSGKSFVCILHEYVQHVLKTQPKYNFSETDNAATPYVATININEVAYGTGCGASKKIAKIEASRATLQILLPHLIDQIDTDGKRSKEKNQDLSFFDEIKVEDARVTELLHKTSELSPYSILLNCLQRNFGLSGNNIESHLSSTEKQKNEYSMTVGKHTVRVPCKNKRDGKQRASQAILQKLHPHINCWGSLLRLYGDKSLQFMRDRRSEEQSVTLLQNNATVHQPNYTILNKLKKEMLKLKVLKKEVQPIGTFVPPSNFRPPDAPGSELNNVDL